jgi:hypothetical protein
MTRTKTSDTFWYLVTPPEAGFEPRTLGTKAERYDHCTTRPVVGNYNFTTTSLMYDLYHPLNLVDFYWNFHAHTPHLRFEPVLFKFYRWRSKEKIQ